MSKDQPRAGSGGPKPKISELFFRRSAKDNVGLTNDIQPLATKRFRKAAGELPPEPPKRKGWFS